MNERTASDGTILQSASNLSELVKAVAAAKPEAVAVSLLFAFANPANEKAVCHALAELGVPISASHKILPEFREYERASTVLINAYLAPKMQTYLGKLDAQLQLSVMQSSGGIIPARIAAEEPVRTILSGPAGGVVGAMHVAAQAGFAKALAFDMGGTSTDVALIDSENGLETTTESQIQGMPVAVPVLRIHTVGAGGGSLASFDGGGALKVGPESAGAVPGPVCYGRGTQPTVTDANLVLGRLDPDAFLGGAMKLDVERTRDALKTAHLSIEAFAEGIIALANSHMAQALRRISVEQGHDPRDFTLVSYGGAGPMHACDLARALKIPRVLIPNFPGALSAYGILLSDITRDYSRTVMLKPHDSAIADYAPDWLDMRYQGQGYELRVPFSGDYVEAFHKLHQQRYGYSDASREIEVVNVRNATSSKPTSHYFLSSLCNPAIRRANPRTSTPMEHGKTAPSIHASTCAQGTRSPPCGDHGIQRDIVLPTGSQRARGRMAQHHCGVRMIDPIELAIFKSTFHSIAEEMGAALRRTAFSPNIKERRDYSSAIFDANGNIIAMGDDMPVHLGSMPMSVRAVLNKLTLEEGDIAILNDPYDGGTHLPDITLVIPVFVPESPRPVFYRGESRSPCGRRRHVSRLHGPMPRDLPGRHSHSSRQAGGSGRALNDALLAVDPEQCTDAARARRRLSPRTDRSLPHWHSSASREMTLRSTGCRSFAPQCAGFDAALRGTNAPANWRFFPHGEYAAEDFLDDDGLHRSNPSRSASPCADYIQKSVTLLKWTSPAPRPRWRPV